MKKTYILLVLLVFCVTHTVRSQEKDPKTDPFLESVAKDVQSYNTNNPIEKAYLHTDKDIFRAEEELWYSAYVTTGANLQYSSSNILFVDLISPENEIVFSQTHQLFNGRAVGSIILPKDLKSGKHQLRAYTNWMRNFEEDFFFTKTINVLSQTPPIVVEGGKKINLQFFPEGGNMINDLGGYIAFKAIGEDGKAKEIEGKVVNTKGELVTTISTLFQGIGKFYLVPKPNEQYTAVLKDGSEYPLPKSMDKGYSITVNNINPENINFIVKANESLLNKPFYLIVHARNHPQYLSKHTFEDKPLLNFAIPKEELPSGVITLTLMDEERTPWCERIVFVNNSESVLIKVKTDNETLGRREKVSLQINVSDSEGNPVVTDLSIAVTDFGQVVKGADDSNILTYFQLQSDLKGYIDQPGQFFNNQSRSTIYKSDLIMLSHGWRRFRWQDNQPTDTLKYSVLNGYNVSGIVYRSTGNPLANRELKVIIKSKNDLKIRVVNTNEEGFFTIDKLNLNDSLQMAFNAYSKLGPPLNIRVVLDENRFSLPLPNYQGRVIREQTAQEKEEEKQYKTASVLRKKIDSIYNFDKIIMLEEVIVSTSKWKSPSERKQTPSTYGINPDVTVFTEDFPNVQTLASLLSGRTAGIVVQGNDIRIRNGGTPLFVLDGNVVPQAFIDNYPLFFIERVEILKGPSAAMFGSRGANGVILLYSGEGRTQKNGSYYEDSSPTVALYGHGAFKEFYSPKYDIKKDEHIKPDHRATLYWNPSIVTDAQGNATVTFFNSDKGKQLQVAIETLTINGIPGACLETFGEEELD